VEERARAKSLSSLTEDLIRPSFTSHRAVAHADCGLNEQVLGSVLSCRLVLNDAQSVEDIIDRTLSDLRTGFGEAKTDRGWFWGVQRDAAVNGSLELESLEARATNSAEQAREYNNPFLDREVLGALGALDLGTVSSLGYELADRKRTYAMLVQPASGASGGPRAEQEATQRRSLEPIGEAPDTQRTLALVKRGSPRELTEFELANGLTVIAQRRRGTPFVTAVLGFHGSSAWATDPALGEASALSETWRVDSAPSQVGLSLRWDEGQDDRHFVARAVAPDLDAVLKALARERFPHFDWPNLRFRRMLPWLTQSENSPDALASRQERQGLFGAHPYAAFAPAARADHVTTQAVDRFLLSVRRPDNAVLVIVSDAEPNAVRAGVADYFGTWAKPSTPKLPPPPPIDLTVERRPSLVIVDKPSSQVDLRFSCLIGHGTGKARVAQEVLADILTDRTHTALRNETGVAYFADGQFRVLAAGASEISVSTSVDTAHVGQALSFLKELSQLDVAEISDADLSWRRFQGLEATVFDDQTTASTANALYAAWLEDRPLFDLDFEQQYLASLSQADLAPSLATCNGHAVIVAVGNRAAIAAAARP
ncbi:MAG TPA: insulinase family protein, partial [Polyangiaceae bacterium]|nr:insulinase family protein [Polyangiaceae bacterium]